MVERQRRVVDERVERAFNRLCDMVELFEEYIEEHMPEDERSLMPNWVDFAKLPSVRALMHRNDTLDDISRAEFIAAVPEMLRDIEQYKVHAKVAIVEHIKHHHSEMRRTLEGVEPADALERYYAYFTCASSECSRVSYATFAEYHAHWRTEHTHHTWMAEDPEMKEWPRVWLSYSLPKVARGVLRANAIPLDTPQRFLNKWVREGRLYCTCGDPAMPLPNQLDFAKLVSYCHGGGTCADQKPTSTPRSHTSSSTIVPTSSATSRGMYDLLTPCHATLTRYIHPPTGSRRASRTRTTSSNTPTSS